MRRGLAHNVIRMHVHSQRCSLRALSTSTFRIITCRARAKRGLVCAGGLLAHNVIRMHVLSQRWSLRGLFQHSLSGHRFAFSRVAFGCGMVPGAAVGPWCASFLLEKYDL